MSTYQKTKLRHHIREIKTMMFGHLDYTKFIILGRSRTGSNFLRGLLNSHSQVITYGEVFQSPDTLGWDHSDSYYSKKWLHTFKNRPVVFIEKKIFRKYPRSVSAVGFKIFYYHAQKEPWQLVWDYLQSNKNIKILHMKRKNLLRTHLSRKKAGITDQWVNINGSKEEERTIILDYQECLEDFLKTRNEESEADNFFRDHQKMDVIYEELSSDYQGKMRQIQSFLNLPYEEVLPATHQQSNLPLSKAIHNYSDLKNKFKGTDWEEFFDE